MKQVLQISAELPTLNETVAETKRHWSRYATLKKTATEIVAWNCKAQKLEPIEDRVTLVFDWPHSRKDPDNQSFGAKMIIDGLVKAGVLPDDSRKWIAEIRHMFRRTSKLDAIVIVEIEGAPMVNINIVAPTRKEAEKKREAYFDNYPTPGYSTSIKEPEQAEDGTWICTGWRGETCD